MGRESIGRCNPAGLVHRYIGTAYDTVKFVADNMEDINIVAELFDYISYYLGPHAEPVYYRQDGEVVRTGDYYFDTTNNYFGYAGTVTVTPSNNEEEEDLVEVEWFFLDINQFIEIMDRAEAAAVTAEAEADRAKVEADKAQASADYLLNMTASGIALPHGSNPTANYDTNTGVLEIGIPTVVINDNLNDDSATEALSSNQGKILNETKVDKVVGKQLSTEDFTTAEKTKLAGLEDSKFKGQFTSLSDLQTAYPTANVGDYAYVDLGIGEDVAEYIWDTTDNSWIKQGGSSTTETPASIKSKYESNPDTNAFTDAEKTKLAVVNVITVEDNLDSTNPENALSANMGNTLKNMIADAGVAPGTIFENGKKYLDNNPSLNAVTLDSNVIVKQSENPNTFANYYDPDADLGLLLRGGLDDIYYSSGADGIHIWKAGNFWLVRNAAVTTDMLVYNSDLSQKSSIDPILPTGYSFNGIWGANENGVILSNVDETTCITFDGTLTDVDAFRATFTVAWTENKYYSKLRYGNDTFNSLVTNPEDYVIIRDNYAVMMLSGRASEFSYIPTSDLINANHSPTTQWTTVDMTTFVDTVTYDNFIGRFDNVGYEFLVWGISPVGNVIMASVNENIIYSYNLNNGNTDSFLNSITAYFGYSTISYVGDKLYYVYPSSNGYLLIDSDNVSSGIETILPIGGGESFGHIITKDPSNEFIAVGNTPRYDWDTANNSSKYRHYVDGVNKDWEFLNTDFLDNRTKSNISFAYQDTKSHTYNRRSAAMMYTNDFVMTASGSGGSYSLFIVDTVNLSTEQTIVEAKPSTHPQTVNILKLD